MTYARIAIFMGALLFSIQIFGCQEDGTPSRALETVSSSHGELEVQAKDIPEPILRSNESTKQAIEGESVARLPEPVKAVATPSKIVAASPKNPPMLRRAEVIDVKVYYTEASEAEDGSGNTVKAEKPVAVELSAKSWPARALDPVLHIGRLEFHHYAFPRLNVLRYTVSDVSLLDGGDQPYVQYGNDRSSRVVIGQKLEVSQ